MRHDFGPLGTPPGGPYRRQWTASIRYPADKLESVRAILAKRIIAAAVDGERDLGRLRDGALLALAQSNP